MATKTTTTVIIDNLLASAKFTCDATTFKRGGSITITYNGATLTFASVADFTTFVSEIMVPLVNKVHDVPGTGIAPFAAASTGTAGPNALQD